MKHFLFGLFFFCAGSVVFAQDQARADSLQQELHDLRQKIRLEQQLFQLALLAVLTGAAALLVLGTGYRNRKKAEAAQLAASKDREFAMQREQLYVNVTHELRTPLTLIISPLEKLAQENPHPLVRTALRSARELELRFNDILKWNKLEAKAMNVTTSLGVLEDELQKIVNRFRPLAEGKGVLLHFETSRERHLAELDFDKIDTILSNLLVNALKFTQKGNDIWVGTDFQEKNGHPHFILTVQDNGEDIPPEILPRIFDRFTQSDAGMPHSIGSGIGLALTKGLVELMGGSIEASSAAGAGAQFSVVLPFQAAAKAPAAPSGPDPAQADPVTGPKNTQESMQVLLVEDNQELREFLAYHFEAAFEVLHAGSMDAGLQSAKEKLPDIIVSDVMLPGSGDGISLCSTLKKDPLTCHIPVIILTARTNFETKKSSLEAGAEAYLTKPFSVEELELTVKNLLENRSRLQARFQQRFLFDRFEPGQAQDQDIFLEAVLQRIQEKMGDSGFGVEELAQSMRISRVQLFKKIKTLTGIPPADLLRGIRLNTARRMLETGAGNVSTVAYSTGFDNPNYFSKAFKKHFGIPPSEIAPDPTQ